MDQHETKRIAVGERAGGERRAERRARFSPICRLTTSRQVVVGRMSPNCDRVFESQSNSLFASAQNCTSLIQLFSEILFASSSFLPCAARLPRCQLGFINWNLCSKFKFTFYLWESNKTNEGSAIAAYTAMFVLRHIAAPQMKLWMNKALVLFQCNI